MYPDGTQEIYEFEDGLVTRPIRRDGSASATMSYWVKCSRTAAK